MNDEVGDIRPSQLIHTFGVGALMDLPRFSAMIMGLQDWDESRCREVVEERLLAGLQRRFGPQVSRLLHPPVVQDDDDIPGAMRPGIPIAAFPRWMRCTVCNRIGILGEGSFEFRKHPKRPEESQMIHVGCGRRGNPAVPLRFVIACRDGHLSDFPWKEYVHGSASSCSGMMRLTEMEGTGDAGDLWVRCECGKTRNLAQAFERDAFQWPCPGHHPHLRLTASTPCEHPARTMLIGASGAWFGQTISALSIPRAGDRMDIIVAQHWDRLQRVTSLEVCRFAVDPRDMPAFLGCSAEDVWRAIERKRSRDATLEPEPDDLRITEWNVLTGTEPAVSNEDFRMVTLPPPEGFESWFERTVVLERLREVRALFGFTRIESNSDFADVIPPEDDRTTSITRGSPRWFPAVEVRGEGIFLQLREDAVSAWEARDEVVALNARFRFGHREFRSRLNMNELDKGYLGVRYVLLHSLSHALMRQLILDCGYSGASVRERLYCTPHTGDRPAMCGILLYTSASDSEGTLGGLAHLGQPKTLAGHLRQALETAQLCASDPLCSEHQPDSRSLHGACCHACLFAPETSCERGNRYLDRAVLSPTFASDELAFFTR